MDLYAQFKDQLGPKSTVHVHRTRKTSDGGPVVRIAHTDLQRVNNEKAGYELVPRPAVTSIDEAEAKPAEAKPAAAKRSRKSKAKE